MTAPTDVSVSGGPGGIVANREALEHLAGTFRHGAAELEATAYVIAVEQKALGDPFFGSDYGTGGRLDVFGLERAHLALAGALERLRPGADDVSDLATKLRSAADGYPWGTTPLDVGPGATLDGLSHLAGLGLGVWGPSSVSGLDPDSVDTLVDLTGVAALAHMVGSGLDGFGAAVPTGRTPVHAPRDLADLIDGLTEVDRTGTGGGIDVRILVGPDGKRRAVVDITGTRTWKPGGSNPADIDTNALAMSGEATAYSQGVLAALRQAGVRSDEPVMLVGHSQGGMVAVTAAAEALRTGEFSVTHVVTAGSPISGIVDRLPSSVRVLALENSRDVVPRLDSTPNPDRRNVTTVSGTVGDGTAGGNHALDKSYRPLAAAADRAGGRSLRDFRTSADGFFTATDAEQHSYRIERR